MWHMSRSDCRGLDPANMTTTDGYTAYDLVVVVAKAATCWWRHLDLVSSIIVAIAKVTTVRFMICIGLIPLQNTLCLY